MTPAEHHAKLVKYSDDELLEDSDLLNSPYDNAEDYYDSYSAYVPTEYSLQSQSSTCGQLTISFCHLICWQYEVINHYLFHSTYFIMFFTPSTRNAIKSSAVNNIEVNQSTNQAVVTFNSGKQYLYSGICEDAMFDIIFGQVKSFGKWVNASCVKDSDVSAFALA